jgi:hypothetical protein
MVVILNENQYSIEIDIVVNLDDALYFPSQTSIFNKTFDKKAQASLVPVRKFRTTYKLSLDSDSTHIAVSKSDFGQTETVITDVKELKSFFTSLTNLISISEDYNED